MEKPNESVKILNMFLHPVFVVKDGVITQINHAAQAKNILVGTEIAALIPNHTEEYETYCGGCLSLTVKVDEIEQIATVVRSEDGDVFHLLVSDMTSEFRTMSLISQQFRKPLSGVLSAIDNLFPKGTEGADPQVAQINRNLYQLLREVSNLSSAQRIAGQQSHHLQMHCIPEIFRETMESAQNLIGQSGRSLDFENMQEDVHCLADSELLERAVFNLVSNAVKFSPADSPVSAKLIFAGKKIRFTIQNQVEEGTDLTNLYARFMREPGIEDGRHGIGLGIPLVQHIASVHGGSLLMDQPAENIIRFTMTIPIRQNAGRVLRSPAMMFDYLGGHNHALVELSDILPAELYNN